MKKILTFGTILLVAVTALYIYWYYYKVYGDGFREGELQKFSRKGDIFKTYEGEMVQTGFGVRKGSLNAHYFYFSVTDEAIADTLEKSIGKIVKLHYRQYKRHLIWRGDNYNAINTEPGQYIVDRVDNVREKEGDY